MVYLDKPEPEGSERGRPEKRRWVIAPPPATTATEIEGISLLEELPSSLAIALFQWYRDALLWASMAADSRSELLRTSADHGTEWLDDATFPAPLQQARSAFSALRADSGSLSESVLGLACGSVSEWANRSGFPKTELAFAAAAARVDFNNPDMAFRAGRAARRNARFEESEEWFRRTVGLARRSDDDAAYGAAYLGWGVLEQVRGRPDRARKMFVHAWRRAKSARLRKIAAAARHYLISLSVGRFEEGMRHSVAAYKLYGAGDYRLAGLATDTGAFLSDHSHFAAARPLFEVAIPLLGDSPDRFVPLSNLARAVAALGDRKRFEEIWLETNRRGPGYSETVPDALIEIAEGARTLRLFRKAAATLDEAIRVATQRREPASLQRAMRLRDELQTKPPDKDVPVSPELARYIRRFVRRLRKQAAPGR